MSRPVILDLFSGAGGAAKGYHDAGFDVIGVDINPQPRYPFRFVQGDALDVLAGWDLLPPFDAIHASPPCQDWSVLHRNYGAPEHGTAELLNATLRALRRQPRPWVVENVVGAPLPSAFVLCGASFGLGASGLDLNRHRLFETSFFMLAPSCQHRRGLTIGVYGNGTNSWHRKKLGRNLGISEMREAMGIDWMRRDELSQAIPPAYTRFIGEQLLAHLAADPRPGPGPKPAGPTGPQPTHPPLMPPPAPVPAKTSIAVPALRGPGRGRVDAPPRGDAGPGGGSMGW